MADKLEFYICDGCGKPIIKPTDGLIMHGNIYVASTQSRGGLIGNNFPIDHKSSEVVKLDNIADIVKESSYCIPCFLNAVLPNVKLTNIR